ncbi:MAG: hypothetical protein IPI43_31865 [Sandaracinaceae bacterium]|nr:hypothetical protein [Sandaracinaceae bacterium]
MNHRIPIRSIDFRGRATASRRTTRGPRCSAAAAPGTPSTRASCLRGGSGVVLRFISAQGEVIESTTIIPTSGGNENVDLGVQFTDQDPSSGGARVHPYPFGERVLDDRASARRAPSAQRVAAR